MEEVYFHDGILHEIHILGEGKVLLRCDLYANDGARSRAAYQFDCAGVTAMSHVIDFVALIHNRAFGNINDGRLENRPGGLAKLKLFLVDGYLEVSAKNIGMSVDQHPV